MQELKKKLEVAEIGWGSAVGDAAKVAASEGAVATLPADTSDAGVSDAVSEVKSQRTILVYT